MRNRPIYIMGIALVMGAVLLAGCEREALRSRSARTITFAPGGLQTKGLIGAEDLATNGTRIRVYDYMTGYEGAIDGVDHTTSDVFQYFTDEISYNSAIAAPNNPWEYESGSEYTWTKRGTHRFYGWLTVDKASGASGILGSDLFGSTLTLGANQTLSVPSVTFTTSSPQFDFSYSNIVSRDVTAASFNPATPVDINLSHLFSAVSITFQNASDIPVQIDRVDIPFPNMGSATINYSGTEPVVTYTDPTVGATPFFNPTALGGTTVAVGDQYSVFTGVQNDQTYYLTWPVPQSIISPVNVIGEENDLPIYASTDSLIAVTYTVGTGVDAVQQTAKAKFPNESLDPAKKNHINIQFTNKAINVTNEVLYWDFNDLSLNFLSDAITTPGTTGKLNVMPNTVTLSGTTARLLSGTPAECYLTILTPVGATLVVSMTGDTDYFEVSPNVMTINAEKLTFYINPTARNTGGVDKSINLSFTVVLPDGREIDANSELIDNNYTFVRQ